MTVSTPDTNLASRYPNDPSTAVVPGFGLTVIIWRRW